MRACWRRTGARCISDCERRHRRWLSSAAGSSATGGHKKAPAALKGYASAGEEGSLKAFAGETAPVVQHHLTMLQGMR